MDLAMLGKGELKDRVLIHVSWGILSILCFLSQLYGFTHIPFSVTYLVVGVYVMVKEGSLGLFIAITGRLYTRFVSIVAL